MIRLSEETVKRLPVPDKGNRVTYFTGALIQGSKAPRGFGVRVTAAGARAFILNYRHHGREHRFTIGAWPDWSALKAVREARNLRQRVDRGENPVEDRTPPLAAASVSTVLDDFVARHVRNKSQPLRSANEYESAFKRLVKPRIGKLGIYEVRRSHINKMLDEIEDENGLVMADRTLAYVRKAFNWQATRDDQFSTPVVRGMARIKPKERARTRVLSDDEIRIIWPVLAGAGTFGGLVKALLLRAQASWSHPTVGLMADARSGQIDNVMKEERLFPPPAEFSAKARIRSMDEYERMCKEAADDLEGFWGRLAGELHWFKPFAKVLEWKSRSPSGSWAARRTSSYNCLDRHLRRPAAEQGGLDLGGRAGRHPRADLPDAARRGVRSSPTCCRRLGVGRGDVVSIYMPLVPELAIAMLACARIGAVHSVIFGGFSAEAIADRNNDARAKLMITADAGWRRGKQLPLKDNVDAALEKSPTVEKCVVLRRIGTDVPMQPGPRPLVARADGRGPGRRAPPSRWTAKRRCSSSTPAARPASPRASSTPRPATTSTSRRPWSGSSTSATRTSTGVRPTSAGSPATATWSTGRWRPGRQRSCTRAPPTGPTRTAGGR